MSYRSSHNLPLPIGNNNCSPLDFRIVWSPHRLFDKASKIIAIVIWFWYGSLDFRTAIKRRHVFPSRLAIPWTNFGVYSAHGPRPGIEDDSVIKDSVGFGSVNIGADNDFVVAHIGEFADFANIEP